MTFADGLKFLLGTNIIKGAGTYAIAALLILAGLIGIALGYVDSVTGGAWIVMGYGLIRARVSVDDVKKKLDEVTGTAPKP